MFYRPTSQSPFVTLTRTAGLLLTVSLLGCARTGSPNPPAGAPRALVYGAVSSPVYDALRGSVAMTSNDGHQNPQDYDLVIVDGDASTGAQLGADSVIAAAIRSGTWVLSVDMSEDDKRSGLGHLMGAHTPGPSKAYLVRRTSEAGHVKYTVMDLNDSAVSAVDDALHLTEKLRAVRMQGQDTVPSPPPGVMLHASYEITQGKYNPLMPIPIHNPEVPRTATQRASWEVITTIDLYLDNDPAYSAEGTQQWAVVQVQGMANPNQLLSNNYEDDADIREVAWYQTQFAASVRTPSGFQVYDTQPKNVNGAQTVTTGSTFSIGASGGVTNGKPTVGVTAGYTYTNSVSRVITDWQVRNDSNSDAAVYRFASNSPTNGLITSGSDLSAIDSSASPKEPNTLSLSNMQYQALTVFKTARGAATRNTVQFGGADDAWYSDVWRYVDGCGDDDGQCYYADIARYNNHQDWAVNVNLGQVYPVQLAGMTVNGNAEGEVTAGSLRVPVVVTLKEPAPSDLNLALTLSNTNNFSFADGPSVLIKQGDTTGTFYINVAENSQGRNGTLSAFYTSEAEAIISVKKEN